MKNIATPRKESGKVQIGPAPSTLMKPIKMNTIHKSFAYVAFGAVVALFSSCGYPVKVTGGGKAVGLVAIGGDLLEDVPATASGQAQLTEPTEDGFTGSGNFQFVDHLNGVAFHAKLKFGGRTPGGFTFLDDFWLDEWDGNWDNLAYAEGLARLRGSKEDVFVQLWLLDQRDQGPDKGDRVIVSLDSGYFYDGALNSGNYKIHLIED